MQLASPALIRLLLGAVLLLGLAVAFTVFAGNASAGGDTVVTVNSTGNFDDGDCEGPPNDDAAGNCTLAEAIDVANAGDADIINFHPPVFSKQSPGVIDIEGGDGCLPSINVDVIIDSPDTGVIIDGDADDDGTPIACDGGLSVIPLGHGHDFTLNGGKNFEIREFEADGIELYGDGFSFGDVDINGVIINDVAYHGIEIYETPNLRDASITNNNISATYDDWCDECGGEDSIDMRIDGPLTDNTVHITDNILLLGRDESVDLEFNGDLDGTLTVNVSDNDTITALEEDAVEIDYAHDSGDAGGSEIYFWVNNNQKIHGGTDAIDIHVQADDESDDGDPTLVEVTINDNARIDGADDAGVDARIEICCSNSDSTSTLTVDNNEDIIGEGDGVHLDVDVCCGDGNDSTVSVSGNESIEGQDEADDDDGDGVYIEVDVGDTGDEESPGTGDSDDNSSLVQVNDNGSIDGGADAGIDIDAEVGSDTEDADDNSSVIEVIGNGPIDGDDDGVDIDSEVGSDTGDSADDNSLLITISDNASIDGDDSEGIYISSDVGVFGIEDDGDDDTTTIIIENNGPIEGGGDDGIYIDTFTGGDIPGSQGNSNSLTINGNEEIVGQSTEDADGIEAYLYVCCDSANTNDVTISGNGDIHGLGGDGIYLEFCCSLNTTTITDNTGTIRGNDGDGLDYYAETDPGCPDCDDSIDGSVNNLTITGNDFDNSENDGIWICCGAFEDEDLGIKSIISGNQIHHNIDDGIDIVLFVRAEHCQQRDLLEMANDVTQGRRYRDQRRWMQRTRSGAAGPRWRCNGRRHHPTRTRISVRTASTTTPASALTCWAPRTRTTV